MEAGGGDRVSVGGAKVMAGGGNWVGRRREPKKCWKAKVGGGNLASVGGAKVMAEAEAEGGNWVERRRVPQKYLKAKTCVIWDMEKRPFPDFCKPTEIARFIRSVVSCMGFGGEIDIIAVGDTRIIKNQIDLLRSGIVVKHSDSIIYPTEADVLDEILSWKQDNPTPGNILLISANRSLSAFLRFIRGDGYYTIRVREPERASGSQPVLGSPDYWDWSDLQEAAGPQQKEASLGGAKARWVGGNWASRNRVEEKFLRAKTCVIWDIEHRPFPDFCKPGEIARFIKSVVSHMGFVGKVDIIAVGNTRDFEPDPDMELRRSGIVLKHSEGGSTYPPVVFGETTWWTDHNLPPANVMLISGHRRFSWFLSGLSNEGYYIIRVRQDATGPDTYAYVLDSWDWSDLLDAGTKKCLLGTRGRGF